MSLSFSHLAISGDNASGRPGVKFSPDAPSYEALERMVKELGGDKPVHSVLVANNGLAAVKFMRSVRNWAFKRFGDERAVKLIAMATPEDMLADAEHIRLADQFIEVAGGRNVNNYANVQLIVSLAVRAQVDAVWPGWGHASEKPELPELLLKTPNGVRFIGPDQYAMAALGDKIGSTILAQSAGVPTLAWSGDGVEITYDACENGEIPDDIYDKACLHNVSEAVACFERINSPIMLKASWGGGGKGIRMVKSVDEVPNAFKQVQAEVPGSPIFAMKLATNSRHLEVQLLADMHGNVCSVFSRDCSVQRRHQKIVEEGPVTVANPETLEHMEKCARSLARSVKYVGAATVEYLYSMEEDGYCFLELNPRLQVEHPVTEWISGVNIPACQVLIAQGVPLHAIPDLRRLYGKDPDGTDPIDFENAEARVPAAGHVIAVRITAENANDGFKPTAGRIEEISFKNNPDVWGYFSVKGGGAVHEFSDSQFGHLFAKAETRNAAIRAMVVALKELKIRGEIRTNSDYVCELIQTEDFVGDVHNTGWLDKRIADQKTTERPPWHLSVICGAAVRSMQRFNEKQVEYLGYLEKGQLPPARISMNSTVESFVVDDEKYTVEVQRTGPQNLLLRLNGTAVDIVVRELNDGGLLIQLDGASHVVHSEEEPSGTRLLIGTSTCMLSSENDPSQLKCLTSGKLIRYLVEDGAHVPANGAYAEIEVMKMVMEVSTPTAGVISFELPEGSVLTPGCLMGRLKLDDPGSVRTATPFTAGWPELGPPVIKADNVQKRFVEAVTKAQNILDGYSNPVESTVAALQAATGDPALALLQWEEAYGIVSSRLSPNLVNKLESAIGDCAADLAGARESGVPVGDMLAVTRGCMESLVLLLEMEVAQAQPEELMDQILEPLMAVARAHAAGSDAFCLNLVKDLLSRYLTVEEQFQVGDGVETEQDIIDAMRKANSSDLQSVIALVVSHNGIAVKADLAKVLLQTFVKACPDQYRHELRRLAALGDKTTMSLAILSQKLLELSLLGELTKVVAQALAGEKVDLQESLAADADVLSPTSAALRTRMTINEGLFAGLSEISHSPGAQSRNIDDRIHMLVMAPAAVEDAIAALLLDTKDDLLASRALTTYVNRMYHPHILIEPQVGPSPAVAGALMASWAFEKQAAVAADKQCFGGAVVVESISDVSTAVSGLAESRTALGMGAVAGKGNLHILLRSCDSSATVEQQAVLEAINAISSSIVDAGYETVSFMARGDAGKRAPERIVMHYDVASAAFVPFGVAKFMEPSTADYLEVSKLSSFDDMSYTSSRNRQWHLFAAREQKPRMLAVNRVFARGIIKQLGRPELLSATYNRNAAAAATAAMKEVGESVASALTELERASFIGENASKADWSHIFLNVASPIAIGDDNDQMKVALALRAGAAVATANCIARLRAASVAQWELRLQSNDGHAWRVVVSIPTGHESGDSCVDIYREHNDGHTVRYTGIVGDCAMNERPISDPYDALETLQLKQMAARRHKTTYCYDFPAVFEHALNQLWAQRAAAGEAVATPPTSVLVDAEELVPKTGFELSFQSTTPLVPLKRPPNQNKVGMVAWLMTLHTPEYPMGRQIVVISNDITHSFGAFGPEEDAMFRAATEFALENRLPVIYLAANSGARVGLANELKQCMNIAWVNPNDPTKGFRYMYLTKEDHDSIMARSKEAGIETIPFKAELVRDEGEDRYRLTDIVGMEDGLGVECLSGSGAIAGVYSKAFKEGFTLTLVSGRTVGIGAYLARLGRRCIQRKDQPIILTGFAALNKLLGREVYTSHMQLGGPKIMGNNGVSHHIVRDDLEGVLRVLEWISYIPSRTGEQVPRLLTADSISRKVAYIPADGEKLNPRMAIEGTIANGQWTSGMFDRGSWLESQSGWARTVVTGRARLGGIPCGVIAVEVDTVMLDIPADPGMPDSSEKTIPQAGQVWFPDSALKTAHAMEEFDLEGLPLFVMANWRGFSGGQRDLFEGVLQAGSLIVENLRSYRHPVFMYIPPGCELRGGAWVVIDSQINPEQIESYADTTGKGGVLEPEGMVEIKFRAKELITTMHRIDPVIKQLTAEHGADHKLVKDRQAKLLPIYTSIAQSFASMHDTPVRMQAKGVIRSIVPWANSRRFFALRLRRRLAEQTLCHHVQAADDKVSLVDAKAMIRSWFLSSPRKEDMNDQAMASILLNTTDSKFSEAEATAIWENEDAEFLQWVEGPTGAARISLELRSLRQRSASDLVAALTSTTEGTEGLVQGLQAAIESNPSLRLRLKNLQ